MKDKSLLSGAGGGGGGGGGYETVQAASANKNSRPFCQSG